MCATCAACNLARYDGMRYGYRADGADSEEVFARTRGDGLRAMCATCAACNW